MRLRVLTVSVAAFLLLFGQASRVVPAADEAPNLAMAGPLVRTLIGQRVASESTLPGSGRTRGDPLRALYRRAVGAVALISSRTGKGAGFMVYKDEAMALVVTNRHVVSDPFTDAVGQPSVELVFYHSAFAGEWFTEERMLKCQQGTSTDGWCVALRRGFRRATILQIAEDRDLAVLRVPHPPAETTPIPLGALSGVDVGDDVAVIGHPQLFLWSLTAGIVGGIRSDYPLIRPQDIPGKPALGTVIQTQTPISGGNSGGPMLALQGNLLGVMTWGFDKMQNLNEAIGVNEVRAFLAPEIRGLTLPSPAR